MPRAVLAWLVCLAGSWPWASAAAHGNRWGAAYFPAAPVLNQDGTKLHFYDDLLKGKIVVVSLIYTRCSDLCPIETARLAEVRDRLGAAVGKSIFFVSLTVDPEHDTPEMLKAFAEAFDAHAPAWQFITGEPATMRAITARFGDRSDRGLAEHRNELLIGNDATGDWQRASAFADVSELAMDVLQMDPGFRQDPQRTAGAGTVLAVPAHAGEALFTRVCAPCHTVGGGDRVGPDLGGVGDRRSRSWLMDFIRDPAAVLARRDPDAMALAARFPAVRMPLLGLGENDVDDLLAFIRDRGARPAATAAK